MRKVILSMMVSLDGFIEPLNPEEEWAVWDAEMEKYIMEFFSTVDTFIYGRVSYQTMLNYWPTATGAFADFMNNTPKLVFSKTLSNAAWNATIIRNVVKEEILKIKQEPGKDLAIFGGADIASTFIKLGLVDEYRLIVNPVVLGNGKPLFKDFEDKFSLKLIKTQEFACGNVLHCYQPIKQ